MTGPAERARLAELAAIVERDREWDSPEPVTWPKHLELVRAAAADRRWLLARLAALEAALEQIAGSRHAADHHSAVIARAALATEGEPTAPLVSLAGQAEGLESEAAHSLAGQANNVPTAPTADGAGLRVDEIAAVLEAGQRDRTLLVTAYRYPSSGGDVRGDALTPLGLAQEIARRALADGSAAEGEPTAPHVHDWSPPPQRGDHDYGIGPTGWWCPGCGAQRDTGKVWPAPAPAADGSAAEGQGQP